MSALKAGRASYLAARKARRRHLAGQITTVNAGGARCSCGWTTAQRGLRTPADALRAHLQEAKRAERAPGAERVVHEIAVGPVRAGSRFAGRPTDSTPEGGVDSTPEGDA